MQAARVAGVSYPTIKQWIYKDILALASTTRPQAAKSELVGEVRDQNGALVSNAKVSLTDVATGQTSSKVSTDGSFIMTNLKPGIYNVAVEAEGFKQSLVKVATRHWRTCTSKRHAGSGGHWAWDVFFVAP